MALILGDRIKETTSIVGTGSATLLGATIGFQSFAAVGNGNTTYYCIADQGGPNWEVGIGTYTASGTTLARTTILASSNAGAIVSFTSGIKDVFVTYPSEKGVWYDASGNVLFTGATTISVTDNTNAALRITQLGTGNALVVEDSANPDSTPTVIDGTGRLFVGAQTGPVIASASYKMYGLGSGSDYPAAFGYTATGSAFGPQVAFAKSRGADWATRGVVASNDVLGSLLFAGDDGTNIIPGAQISSFVDGTPGTNDMPGRLVFSTTADGASSPTERMRIDNAGRVGIGATPIVYQTLTVSKNLTGFTSTRGIVSSGQIQSDSTAGANYFSATSSTQATTFNTIHLGLYSATQGTFGVGSTVTNQYGFSAGSSLTGATNNYGFYGTIASGTGRYNLYMDGTASNYLAGSLGIDSTALTGYNLRIGKNLTGLVDSVSVVNFFQINSDVTASATGFQTQLSTQAAAFTLSNVYHFNANALTIGAASVVNNQLGFSAGSSLTGATNNYGFYGNIAAGIGRYNLYMGGTASNYLAGSLGIGTSSLTGYSLRIGKDLTGSATLVAGVQQNGNVMSDATGTAVGFRNLLNTQTASFTNTSYYHFSAETNALGVGSAITNQIGFIAQATLTGATNNYSFYGGIASGTGRYNLYMNGTADNYFAGSLGIGSTPATGATLDIRKNITGGINSYGVLVVAQIQSDVTVNVSMYQSQPSTVASAFTLSSLRHYYATQGTIGAGSAVTSQYGFLADASLTGAVNNYGFFGNIASGTGRYNLYMAGTASNYFGGPLITAGLKATSAASPTIASATTIAPTTQIAFISGTTAIATITAPSPISLGGGQITLIPTGIFTTTTAGNIALASTAVVGKALIMTYDATTTKWYPSY